MFQGAERWFSAEAYLVESRAVEQVCSEGEKKGGATVEKEVVIWSSADQLGGKSHSDTDLRRTMHTNEIITDMVGGLLGLKKEKKKPHSCHNPLFRDRG